ncbi:helix-turn-helix domain-containing protein [Mesorhizobium sp. CA12]|uniref:AlbA family DNA-binding domain-containing protein n=1 Tax=Mesorhizobium sp. CA12 TaxID=2876644 RepID=UPI001CCF0F20|nr:ATP-binding protein [Mesorhizobium sp. CA12]MBZ9863113.1 ATP-binding protein [Mesorhizobium sp. CA12]
MLTDTLLEELRCRGEGSDLDYKAERYPFAKASDQEKSEILKDILALANAHRDGTAYILIGFKENPPHPAELVGISPDGTIDDSRLQEFVNGKLESKLNFRYEERLFDGQQIAVISIPKQQRPFYLKKDYGKLIKDVVYVRRGSSTGVASPREVALMGAANTARGEARVLLSFEAPDNQPLSHSFDREFLVFPKKLPDFAENRNEMFSFPTLPSNKNYWRDGAYYYSSWRRVIQVRLLLANKSEFSIGDAHLEVTCHCPEGESVSLLRSDCMPEVPDTSYLAHVRPERANQFMFVDDRGCEPVAHIIMGTIRPGQTVRAEEDLAILPSAPGRYLLQVRILANEIPIPLLIEHELEVVGPVAKVGPSDFFALMNALSDESED